VLFFPVFSLRAPPSQQTQKKERPFPLFQTPAIKRPFFSTRAFLSFFFWRKSNVFASSPPFFSRGQSGTNLLSPSPVMFFFHGREGGTFLGESFFLLLFPSSVSESVRSRRAFFSPLVFPSRRKKVLPPSPLKKGTLFPPVPV